ncbi:MAG TPA: hypothetical protein DF715_05185, partial [Oceanicaulis sp.]|nr:hypothetical protein [Oceanicaulis sp.]
MCLLQCKQAAVHASVLSLLWLHNRICVIDQDQRAAHKLRSQGGKFSFKNSLFVAAIKKRSRDAAFDGCKDRREDLPCIAKMEDHAV